MTPPGPGMKDPREHATNDLLKCVWMLANVVPFKLCDREYECEGCVFDRGMQGHPATHSHEESTETLASLNEGAGLFVRCQRETELINVAGFKFSRHLFYHPGHTWSRVEEEARVRIGPDDFAMKLIGRLYGLRLPGPGDKVMRNHVCCHLVNRAGEASLVAPVSGTVIDRNKDLLQLPSLASLDPYGRGWMLLVEAEDLVASLKALSYGRKAEVWYILESEKLEREIQALRVPVPSDLGVTLQDGGLLISELSRFLSVSQFEGLADKFLSSQAGTPPA